MAGGDGLVTKLQPMDCRLLGSSVHGTKFNRKQQDSAKARRLLLRLKSQKETYNRIWYKYFL